jgi:flagellar hook-associated protein 2
LAFSAGTLNAGDSFRVQGFSPVLQEASDAEIAFGAGGGGGSPIVVTNSSNRFDSVIPGVILNVKQVTAPGQTVSVTTDIDVSGIKDAIKGLLDAYNDVNKFIDDQNSYNKDTDEAGILLGDSIVQSMQYSIRGIASSRVNNAAEQYSYLSSIGIRTNAEGELSIRDSSRLEEALREDLNEVIALFTDSGYASTNNIEFVSAQTDSREGEDYQVDITQAATRGTYTGTEMASPASSPIVLDGTNNRLILTVDGLKSNELILAQKTYESPDELVREIQSRIDADRKIGITGVTVSWQETESGQGQLVFTSAKYGANSRILVDQSVTSNAATLLGLASGLSINGLDVQGTINGEEATGVGQVLSGNNGNKTTSGLKLKITMTADQLGDGAEGTVTLAKGLASKMNTLFTSLTKTGDGLIDRRIKSYEDQVQNLADRISEFDERLELRRERLLAEYQAMEAVLAEMSSTSNYLTAQIESFNNNWGQIRSNSQN